MRRHSVEEGDTFDFVAVEQVAELDSELVRKLVNEFLVVSLVFEDMVVDALP